MIKAILLLLPSLMVACANYSPIYWGWGEWSDSNVARLENSSIVSFGWTELPGVITSIDGTVVSTGYKKARLSPGKHRIEYAYYPAEFGVHPMGIMEMDLIAGHLYEFRIKLCFWCKPRKYTVWVDDKTTGEVVWGKHPDWPSWWL